MQNIPEGASETNVRPLSGSFIDCPIIYATAAGHKQNDVARIFLYYALNPVVFQTGAVAPRFLLRPPNICPRAPLMTQEVPRMTKLTIEIDMDDTQEAWDALYERIEKFSESDDKPKNPPPNTNPVTYDLLLDPERAFGEVGDFFTVLTGQE